MALLDNFINFFKPKVEQPTLTRDALTMQLLSESKVLPLDYLQWYKSNPFVFTAITERAKAIANANFHILTDSGELVENELTEKLNNPNDYQSKEDWLRQLVTFQSIWGTGYIYTNKLRPSKPIQETSIINIPANCIEFENIQNVDILLNQLTFKEEKIKILYRSPNTNLQKELESNNLLPLFDTAQFSNPFYSESRLQALQYAVSNIQAALESQNTFLSCPNGIGMIVSKDQKDAAGMTLPLTPTEQEQLENDLQNSYGSLKGQRNIQVVGKEVDFISTVPDIKALELSPTMLNNGLLIFGAFDLPKEVMAALMSGATFENQKEAYKRFIQTAGQDYMDNVANTLNKAIPSKEGKLIASFDHLPIMQEDKKLEVEVKKTEADTLSVEKAIWDDWLLRGLIKEIDYKQKFGL